MTTAIVFDGVTYNLPALKDSSWFVAVNAYLTALSTGTLQRSGGAFTLTSNLDFGGLHGVIANFVASNTNTNPAVAGWLRLNAADTINWYSSHGDYALSVDGNNLLQWLHWDTNTSSMQTYELLDMTSVQSPRNKTFDGDYNTFTHISPASLSLPVYPSKGGTGIANDDQSTITIANKYPVTLRASGAVDITLPFSGTVATVSNAESFTNKTFNCSLNTLSNITLAMFAANVVDTDSTLAANSDLRVCTQKAIKSYLAAQGVAGGTVQIAYGGTGQNTQQAAIDALTGTQSSGKYLRSDGTHATLATIQAGDVPTLNQNTTGTAASCTGNAANVTGTVAIANGGTGQVTQQAAIDALAGTQSSGKYLRSDGTHTTLTTIQAGDVPTLNQNTSGTSANVTGTVAIANGGSGQVTQQAAIDALAGTQSSGKYLRSDGTHTTLTTIQAGDVPTLNQNTSGTAANVTGTVAIANGGSGQVTQQAAIDALTGTQSSGKYLRSDGTHATLATIQAADVPTLNQNTSGTAANVTGTVAADHGGTGVANNAASTLTISGAYGTTLTVSNTTALTLPTSGTVATLAGSEPLTNKKLNGGTASTTNEWLLPAKAGQASLSSTAGNVMFDSTTGVNKPKVYDGTSWKALGGGLSPVVATVSTHAFTAVAGNRYIVDWGTEPTAVSQDITCTIPPLAVGDQIEFITVGNKTGVGRLILAPNSADSIIFDGGTVAGSLSDTLRLLPCDPAWFKISAPVANKWYCEGQAQFVSGTFAGNLTVTGSLTPNGGIVGKTDGVAVAAGYVGQTITWATPPTSTGGFTTEADWTNATITLTAGVWIVYANISLGYAITSNANSDRGSVFIKITDSSNVVVANQYKGFPVQQTANTSAGTLVQFQTISCTFPVAISASTTYKIRAIGLVTQGTGTAYIRNEDGYRSEFFAVRMA